MDRRNRRESSSSDEEEDLHDNHNGMEALDSVIEVMNELYEVGHRINMEGNVKIDLPQIVVCGSQSSGKTSVLESISGEEFLPRGVDIQTRCPIVLQLIHTNDGSKWVEFPHIPNKRFTDMEDVKVEIQKINRKIIESRQVVSDDPITLRLHSPQVPNLTLCDLPGLVENPTKEQPPDLVEKINDLVYKYISNENSVILAVSAATNDIADSKSIRIAREVDPKGKRTLGVLTKLDLMDRGTDASDVLLGHRIKLDLGIVGVVNRGFMDVKEGKSLQDQLKNERLFLKAHYPALADTNGIPYLIQKISALLMKTIKHVLPELKTTVQHLIDGQQQIMDDLGEPEEEMPDKKGFMLKILTEFAIAYKAQIDGNRRDLDLSSLNASARIKAVFDQKLGVEFERFVAAKKLTDKEIELALHNSRALHSRHVSHDDAFQELTKHEIKKLEPYAKICAKDVRREMQMAIHAACDEKIKTCYPRLYEKIEQVAMELINERFADCQKYLYDFVHAEASIARTIKGAFRDRNGGYVQPSSASNSNVSADADTTTIKANNGEVYTYVDAGNKSKDKRKQPRESRAEEKGEQGWSSSQNGGLPLENLDVHIANVRKEVTEYLYTVKMQIMESVARGIVYKLVYGSADNMSNFLLGRLHLIDNAEYLLTNTNAEEIRQRRQQTEKVMSEYEDANRVIERVLEKVDTVATF